ncbi:MAG: YdcF family protein [Flavobacteriaceae bacterium]|nr:YdcF family protein [Flavobacteriaceae bacterium]
MTKIKRILIRFLKYFFIIHLLGILTIFIVPYFGNSCKSNSDLKKFDVIIVLGVPATDDCNPGSIMKDRIAKGIELFNLGYADRILFTGSSVKNNCNEADVMAEYAILNGIPETSILREKRAENTYQNAFYSVAKMKELDLISAAVVTSKPHVKRSCAVFSKFNIDFSMFGANNPNNISKMQLLLWKFIERMILSHHIIFGYQ